MKSVVAYNNRLNDKVEFTLPYVQKFLNWFVFFLAFPAINLLGNSITFYIFLGIVFKYGIFWTRAFPAKRLIFSFLAIVLLSTFLAPYSDMPRHPGFGATFKMLIQFTYWILTAAFFSLNFGKLDSIALSRYAFYGILCSAIGFYLFPLKYDLGFVDFAFAQTRNSFVFILLALVPISFIYLYRTYKRKVLPIFYFLFLFITLFTNGRSGGIIIILELVLIASIFSPIFLRSIKMWLLPMFLLFFALQSSFFQPILATLANSVENINPRFANLLRNEEDGDLTSDKSWLLRKLMVDKGLELVPKYPLLGIGPNNFVYMDAELSTMNNYIRLSSQTKEFYNSRSAHNSYIQLVVESGIIGFMVFLALLFFPLKHLLIRFFRENLTYYLLPIVGLLGISLHFYAISGLTGALPWFIIGLSWGALKFRYK